MILKEYTAVMAYDPGEYSSASKAVKEFLRINPLVAKSRTVPLRIIKSFISNNYKGGREDHNVSLIRFAKCLRKRGIKIKDSAGKYDASQFKNRVEENKLTISQFL